MRSALVLTSLLVPLAAIGCKDPDVSDHPMFQEERDNKRESDIVKIETPVRPGVQVPCDELLSAGDVAALLEEETVTIKDDSSTKPDETAVCRIHKDGKPPSIAAQERASEKSGILGVLPGDEICTIEARCSTPSSVEGLVERCEDRGDVVNEDLGVPACVHSTQRGTRWAYTYRVYDTETQCIFRVLGGPSVTDEELVRRCTDVALTVTTPDSLAAYAD
jgi:hypothetical protein